MGNEFRGRTLEEAVRRATALDRRPQGDVLHAPCRKEQRRCNNLILEIQRLQSGVSSLENDAKVLARDADSLRRRAQEASLFAAVSAIGALAGSARAVAAAVRIVRAKSIRNIALSDVADLVVEATVLGGAILAVRALKDFDEAEDLADQAETVQKIADYYGERLEDKIEEYEDAGCSATAGA